MAKTPQHKQNEAAKPDPAQQPDPAQPATAPLTEAAPAAPYKASRRVRLRNGCLLFGGGVLTGLLLLPALIWVLLAIIDDPPAGRPSAPLPGQPDATIALSRSYLERTIETVSQRTSSPMRLSDVIVELGPHQGGGAAMVIRGQADLPLFGGTGVAANVWLFQQEGKLVAQVERLAFGGAGVFPVPGQRLIKSYLSNLVSSEIQQRIEGTRSIDISISEVRATTEQLFVDAKLTER